MSSGSGGELLALLTSEVAPDAEVGVVLAQLFLEHLEHVEDLHSEFSGRSED